MSSHVGKQWRKGWFDLHQKKLSGPPGAFSVFRASQGASQAVVGKKNDIDTTHFGASNTTPCSTYDHLAHLSLSRLQ